jgi:hypothetical protein
MNVVERHVRRAGRLVWAAVWAGPVLWLAHLTANSALVRFNCNAGWLWLQHAGTAAAAAGTLAALAACTALARRAPDREDAATAAGRTRFLGLFGVLVNAVSLALILLEGSYALFINPCR